MAPVVVFEFIFEAEVVAATGERRTCKVRRTVVSAYERDEVVNRLAAESDFVEIIPGTSSYDGEPRFEISGHLCQE